MFWMKREDCWKRKRGKSHEHKIMDDTGNRYRAMMKDVFVIMVFLNALRRILSGL